MEWTKEQEKKEKIKIYLKFLIWFSKDDYFQAYLHEKKGNTIIIRFEYNFVTAINRWIIYIFFMYTTDVLTMVFISRCRERKTQTPSPPNTHKNRLIHRAFLDLSIWISIWIQNEKLDANKRGINMKKEKKILHKFKVVNMRVLRLKIQYTVWSQNFMSLSQYDLKIKWLCIACVSFLCDDGGNDTDRRRLWRDSHKTSLLLIVYSTFGLCILTSKVGEYSTIFYLNKWHRYKYVHSFRRSECLICRSWNRAHTAHGISS